MWAASHQIKKQQNLFFYELVLVCILHFHYNVKILMVKIFCTQQQQQQQHQIKDNNKQQESKRNNIYVPYDLCYNITSDFSLYPK